jgi:hypothetical protein
MSVSGRHHQIVFGVQLSVPSSELANHFRLDRGRYHRHVTVHVHHTSLVRLADDKSSTVQAKVNALRFLITFGVSHLKGEPRQSRCKRTNPKEGLSDAYHSNVGGRTGDVGYSDAQVVHIVGDRTGRGALNQTG